jgi:hypothetical protein
LRCVWKARFKVRVGDTVVLSIKFYAVAAPFYF